jgi:hypothetical protein
VIGACRERPPAQSFGGTNMQPTPRTVRMASGWAGSTWILILSLIAIAKGTPLQSTLQRETTLSSHTPDQRF